MPCLVVDSGEEAPILLGRKVKRVKKQTHTVHFLPFGTPIRTIGICPERGSNPRLPDY